MAIALAIARPVQWVAWCGGAAQVSATDRERLEAIVADRNGRQKHVERARIVLASADRRAVQQVARSIGVNRPTVWRWQRRFAEAGVEGLLRDKTRKPGKAPIAADKTAQIVRCCLDGSDGIGDSFRAVCESCEWFCALATSGKNGGGS
jgi:transposase